MTYLASNKPITLPELGRMKHDGQKIAMLTGYDASFAALEDRCGVDVILVGDSLGNVLQGKTSTLPVTMEQMVYHTECVGHMAQRAMCVADMPFGSYQESKELAYRNAVRAMQETGCSGVKLEGGAEMAETIRFLAERGVPVMGHVGLQPQSVNTAGGYRIRGRQPDDAKRVIADAKAVADAGAFSIVVEGVVEPVARELTKKVSVPTIGIGASAACDGQVLVSEDLLGLFTDFTPKFVKRYADLGSEVSKAVESYAADVRGRRFPAEEHTFGATPKVTNAPGRPMTVDVPAKKPVRG